MDWLLGFLSRNEEGQSVNKSKPKTLDPLGKAVKVVASILSETKITEGMLYALVEADAVFLQHLAERSVWNAVKIDRYSRTYAVLALKAYLEVVLGSLQAGDFPDPSVAPGQTILPNPLSDPAEGNDVPTINPDSVFLWFENRLKNAWIGDHDQETRLTAQRVKARKYITDLLAENPAWFMAYRRLVCCRQLAEDVSQFQTPERNALETLARSLQGAPFSDVQKDGPTLAKILLTGPLGDVFEGLETVFRAQKVLRAEHIGNPNLTKSLRATWFSIIKNILLHDLKEDWLTHYTALMEGLHAPPEKQSVHPTDSEAMAHQLNMSVLHIALRDQNLKVTCSDGLICASHGFFTASIPYLENGPPPKDKETPGRSDHEYGFQLFLAWLFRQDKPNRRPALESLYSGQHTPDQRNNEMIRARRSLEKIQRKQGVAAFFYRDFCHDTAFAQTSLPPDSEGALKTAPPLYDPPLLAELQAYLPALPMYGDGGRLWRAQLFNTTHGHFIDELVALLTTIADFEPKD